MEDKRITKEIKRLTELFKDMDANKLAVSKSLIERAAFITVSLQDLEEILQREGWVEGYQNGANQHGVKKSACADVHISLTKNLNSIMKQLLDMVPAAQERDELAELLKS